MEFTWAILMVLGIFVGMPLLLAAVGGVYALVPKLASRTRTAKVVEAAEEHSPAQAPETVLDVELEGHLLWT